MSAIKPNAALLRVGEQGRLPEICCNCDQVTRRTVTIRRSAAAPDEARPGDGNERVSSQLLHQTGLLGFAAWLIIAILEGSGRGRIKVVVRLRQRGECARKQRLEPILVDLDYFQMHFLVTMRFAEQFVELNPDAMFCPAEVTHHTGK